MIKKLLLAIMIALPMSVFAQKFGTVNTADLMESLPEMKTVQEQMTAASNKYQDEFTKLQEEFNKKYQEFQQAIAKDSLPPNIAERRQKELQDMMQRQEQFQQDAQQQMAKAQNDAMAPIYQKLDNAIKAVGAAEGVIYIFDLARTSIPYVNESQSINLTSKVKANLGIK